MARRHVRDVRARRPSGQDGAAATEFVLIAPILIVIFFGIVFVGLSVYRAQIVEAAAREGARVASVGSVDAEVRAAVEGAAPGFAPSEITYDTVDLCTTLPDDTTVAITVSGPRFDYTIPFLGSYSPTFGATATFRCEKRIVP